MPKNKASSWLDFFKTKRLKSLATFKSVLLLMVGMILGSTFIAHKPDIERGQNKIAPTYSAPTSYPEPTEDIFFTDTVEVIEPYLGLAYHCRKDKLSIVKESFNAYNQSVNVQNICFDNQPKINKTCTNDCGEDIKAVCNEELLYRQYGYKDKASCYSGEDPKFQACLNDCTDSSTEERKRCNAIDDAAKEDMKKTLKSYCEISID